MRIESVEISSSGYMRCKSEFYTVEDVTTRANTYHFFPGINALYGECDSGNWGISYLLSMYQHERYSRKHIINSPLIAKVNGETVPLEQIWDISCYMVSGMDPLFASRKTVRQLVQKAINKNHLSESVEDIQRIFHIENVRFDRRIQYTGHEVFRMMAAIGYCNGKEIFCFPWMSESRFDAFTGHLADTLRILDSLNKIVILPVSEATDIDAFWRTSSGSEIFQKYWNDSRFQDFYTHTEAK
ncbi:hypothetical protein [Neglectibacter caecimuris]|uniref:hypothetical protein n=1 Tax=Neglectibacter caecimuris TaxID=3093658 RepID=UPI002AC8C7B8|nr:hypothetical protein [Neglectibacter sp. M00184]